MIDHRQEFEQKVANPRMGAPLVGTALVEMIIMTPSYGKSEWGTKLHNNVVLTIVIVVRREQSPENQNSHIQG